MTVEKRVVGYRITIDPDSHAARVDPVYETGIVKKSRLPKFLLGTFAFTCVSTLIFFKAHLDWTQLVYIAILQANTWLMLYYATHPEKRFIIVPPKEIHVVVKKIKDDDADKEEKL